MLRNLLMYLFTISISRIDSLVITITVILIANSKYKYTAIFLLISGIIIALVKAWLGM